MAPHRPLAQWRLHTTLLAGLAICVVGFVVELHRGLAGHLPAWAYVFEWPFFAAAGTIMWWRLIHTEEPGSPPTRSSSSHEPPGGASEDADLLEWRHYVERLQRNDEHLDDPRVE